LRLLRRRWAIALAALSLVVAAPTTSVHADADGTPRAVASKQCGAGYTHAVLPGGHKCLRAGQFCARRYNRYYHRHGFHCKASGRLTYY
jgi:hypothetical protein